MAQQFFLRSIDNQWREILRRSEKTVYVFSPYLTGPTALSVMKHVDPNRCEVHTVCSLENFASGASSLTVLRTLLKREFRLFHIDNLHAKIIIAADECATIGSQNITSSGRRNREASVLISSREEVGKIEHLIQDWIRVRRPIYVDELNEIGAQVQPLKREMRQLTERIAAKQREVDESRRRREREVERQQEVIAKALQSLGELAKPASISLETAKEFVRQAAHIKNGENIYRAPRHARNVIGPPHDWRFDVSQSQSNKFLITRAINRCARCAQTATRRAVAGTPDFLTTVRLEMSSIVNSSVANNNDAEYSGQYGSDPDWIWFGINGIKTDAFVDAFIAVANLRATFKAVGII